jgi:hypothetical protein
MTVNGGSFVTSSIASQARERVLSVETRVVVATCADLNLLAGTQGSIAYVSGYRSLNDGGQGSFYFDPNDNTAQNGGTTFAALGGGLWKRYVERASYRNVKWFGAYGDGAHDDTGAIESALLSLSIFAWGAELYFPAGDYCVSRTIKVQFGGSTTPWSNMAFRGESATTWGFPGVRWLWIGPDQHPTFVTPAVPVSKVPEVRDSVMLQVASYGFLAENIQFTVKPGFHCGALLNIGHDQTSGGLPATSNVKFRHCSFNGGGSTKATTGTCNQCIVLDLWENYTDQNLENIRFESCGISTAKHALVWVRNTTQGFGLTFRDCIVSNSGMVAEGMEKPGEVWDGQEPWGIFIRSDSSATSFTVMDTEIQRVACHYYLTNPVANFTSFNVHAECYKKLLWAHPAGGGASQHSYRIDGGRYSPDHVFRPAYGWYTNWDDNTTGENDWDSVNNDVIRIGGDGPLFISGCAMGAALQIETTIYANASVDIISIGNRYGGKRPFRRSGPIDGTDQPRTISLGDTGFDAAFLPAQVYKLPTLTGCLTGSGTVTISGSSTSAVVNLVEAESSYNSSFVPFTPNYIVDTSVYTKSASAVVGVPYVSNIAASSFTVNVSQAPGVGQSIVISYRLRKE